jgi:FkbM family methyltransferase
MRIIYWIIYWIRNIKLVIYKLLIALLKLKGIKLVQLNLPTNTLLVSLEDEGISRTLFVNNVHEQYSTNKFLKNIKESYVHLEIGANIGYYALMAAKNVGSRGKIISLEPNKNNMKLLKANVIINNYTDNFEYFDYAASSSDGEKDFYITNKSNTCSFIERNDKYIFTKDICKVQTITLDNLLNNQHIDYFRMDVEGYEFEVLKGMRSILSRKKSPIGCFIEVHSEILKDLGYSAKEFIQYLENFNYDVELAMYRGKPNIAVKGMSNLYNHELLEVGYWEIFFKQKKLLEVANV